MNTEDYIKILLKRAMRAEELVVNLRAENARLRQQRDAANAQLDFLVEEMKKAP